MMPIGLSINFRICLYFVSVIDWELIEQMLSLNLSFISQKIFRNVNFSSYFTIQGIFFCSFSPHTRTGSARSCLIDLHQQTVAGFKVAVAIQSSLSQLLLSSYVAQPSHKASIRECELNSRIS